MLTLEPARTCTLTQGLIQYRRMLSSFIYSLVRDVVATEEIFQEVALVAIEKDKKGDEEIREPARWLRGAAWRIVQAGFRTKQGRLITVDQEYLEQVAEVFESETAGDFQKARVAALGHCLDRVSLPIREVLHRHYVQGATYEQIGASVGRTPGVLRVLVHRVMRQLLTCIERRLATEEEF
jgi:RNA polymerase sigma-70 factor (ECF subfamily)